MKQDNCTFSNRQWLNLSETLSALKNISQWKETKASTKSIIAIKWSDDSKLFTMRTFVGSICGFKSDLAKKKSL